MITHDIDTTCTNSSLFPGHIESPLAIFALPIYFAVLSSVPVNESDLLGEKYPQRWTCVHFTSPNPTHDALGRTQPDPPTTP